MATGNMRKYGIMEETTNQDSYRISSSHRILQDSADMYINPEESVSVDIESALLQNDLNSETPNKYPNAPHPSPIDLQNGADSSVFNLELVKCLNELPVIFLNFEGTKDCSTEAMEIDTEYPLRNYFQAAVCTESNVKSDDRKKSLYQNKSSRKSYSEDAPTTAATGYQAWDDNNESTKSISTNINNQLGRFKYLSADSLKEFNSDFHKRSSLKDNTSIIVNCSDDASDISLEDVESVSSDDGSSCASRDRIEFEALALDSTFHPSTFQQLQHWRTPGRNKRALSLDEVSPSKLLHTTEFSKSLFELTI